MAKRRTIGKDPLSAGIADFNYSAEIVPMPKANPAPQGPSRQPEQSGQKPIIIDGKSRRAVGGRLEILGGDFGAGSRPIWPLGDDGAIGFVAPSGRRIDLGRELVAVAAWPDRTDRRYLGAAGWAWVLASLGGVVGLLAGGGLRLLEPRRMMVTVQLDDGAKLVARTDSVTVAGLRALADSRSAAKA